MSEADDDLFMSEHDLEVLSREIGALQATGQREAEVSDSPEDPPMKKEEPACTEKTHEILKKITDYKYCVHCGKAL